MVDEYKAVKDIVASESYRRIFMELAAFLKIAVDSNYEEIFARLDSAKMVRAELNKSDIDHVLEAEAKSIKTYSINKYLGLQGVTDEQDYPEDAKPSADEKDIVLAVGNYAQGFLLTNIIEYILAKEGAVRLQQYFKLSRIPKAKEYSKQVLNWVGK